MDLERAAFRRGAGWIFRQIVGQLERELFVPRQWRRGWEERDVRVWSYGQLRRTYACRNLPEDLRRETTVNRTSLVICVEPIVASRSIICNRSFEARQRDPGSLRLPFSRRYARPRRYRADRGMVWRIVSSGTSDNRVHVRQRPSQRLFLLCLRLRRAGLICDAVMWISYDSRSRLVSVEGVWVLYGHFIIQLVLVQFPREVECVFFRQDDARLPEALRQLPWPVSFPRLFPIEMHARVWNWIGSRIFCVLSSTTILEQS